MKLKNKIKKLSRRTLLLVAGLILVLTLIGFGLSRKQKTVSETIPSTSTSSTQSTSPDKTSNNAIPSINSQVTNDSTKPSNSTNLTLIAPWGNFVSNHSPGKNGSSTSEASTCTTTPGATCYIQFTKNNTIKTLESKKADNNGAVQWDWDISSAGLSSGKWQITAIATLDEQTKSTPDQLPLEIQ